MRPLMDVITVDKKFQKSINMRLDYNQMEKINSYIPTRASVAILHELLEQFTAEQGMRSSILIGPYGKGKSHLLLILLALLVEENRKEKHPEHAKCIEQLVKRLERVDAETAQFANQLLEEKKVYLPVIVNAGQNALSRSFLLALKESLERVGLGKIAPDTYFEEAKKTIAVWKTQYPTTYENFQEKIKEEYASFEGFYKGLDQYEEHALEYFQKIYPMFTAGSQFEPMVQMDVITLYRSINDILCREYGYAGIVVIFDEFSKFVEGYPKEHFSAAMAELQNLCELANSSKGQEVHVILVAHKAMKEYQNVLPKEVIDAYTGVEGRLREIYFTTSLKNSYELIGNVIQKEEKEFAEYFKSKAMLQTAEKAYGFSYFSHLFQSQEFEKIVVQGCYPFTPVSAYLLLKISEIAVQNERTVFTFLTNEEPYSLPYFLKEAKLGDVVGAGQIYDYFANILKKDISHLALHNEWLKAEYALSMRKDKNEQAVIKTMALLHMVGKHDEMYAMDDIICMGSGLSKEVYQKVITDLMQEQIVLYRTKTRTYAFKNNVGIDVEKELREMVQKKFQRISLCQELERLSELTFELPKRYNQTYSMTRYFAYKYMTVQNFLELENTNFLFEEQFSDGKIVALIREKDCACDLESIRNKTEELQDRRLVVIVPEEDFSQGDIIRKILAIKELEKEEEFSRENKAVLQELDLYEEDLKFELNVYLEKQFMPLFAQCSVVYDGNICEKSAFGDKHLASKFNQFLSEITEQYYEITPKINNEMINKRKLTAPIKKARIKIIENILNRQDYDAYGKGTAPEATIFRAVFLRTGVVTLGQGEEQVAFPKDPGVAKVLDRIEQFICRATKEKQSFADLYQKLQGEHYGVRSGVLPLYLAFCMQKWEQVAVIYLRGKEIGISAQVFDNINENPKDYEIYIEEESVQKKVYLDELERVFEVQNEKQKESNRLLAIYDAMYEWFCSLPQVSRNCALDGKNENERKGIKALRKSLLRGERNPHELFFSILPKAFGIEAYTELVKVLADVKLEMEQYDTNLKQQVVQETRQIVGLNCEDSLLLSLKEWGAERTRVLQVHVLTTQAARLLKEIDHLETHNEGDIVNCLSRCLLEQFIEDWKENSFAQYQEKLQQVVEEVSVYEEQNVVPSGQRFVFTNQNGMEVEKYLTVTSEDSSCEFLENEIECALEEFEDTLETDQKIAVMLKMIEKLLEGN